MPAPDLQTLFDPETPIEAACKTVLEADEFTVFTPRSEVEELPTPRLELELHLGAVTGHRGLPIINGTAQGVLDAWHAQLVFRAVTARNQNAATHVEMRKFLRLRMQIFQNALTPELLPYHVVTSILEAGTEPSQENDLDLDISAISFACVVSIRTSAWPVS